MKWMQLAFFSTLDVGISLIVSQFAEPGSKALLFVACLAVLWLLPFATGLWSLAKFWIGYHLFVKRRLVRYFKAKMHESNFPPSAAFIDHMSYLSHVLDDAEDENAKLKAAVIVGELTCYKESKPFTMGIAAQSALEVAMEEYRPST